MDFDDSLDRFKAEPKRENVMLMLSDNRLLGYAVIFKQTPPERKLVDGEPMHPIDSSWTALWDCVTVDYKTIAMLADDELVKAQKMVERMKGMRLIYPDGALQELATKLITKRILDAVV